MSIEKILEDFDKQFPCIEQHCNDNGSILVDDNEGLAKQCQYCHENRLPIKEFIKNAAQQIKAELFSDEVLERVANVLVEKIHEKNEFHFIDPEFMFKILKEELLK